MFVRAANPIWWLPDLIGQSLNDEYYAFFLTNTLPYLPQSVFRDPQGLTAWPNPLQFFPNGTLPNNLYFDPNLVYRIEVRHGNSQTDPLIYEVNDFVPGQSSGTIVSDLSILTSDNQIANGNFSQVNFTTTIASPTQPVLTITAAGTYDIAPGWQLVLTGSGTTTITQLIFSGSSINSSPNAINYALRVANSGWSSAILRQRFNNNGAIFTGGAISISVTARAQTTNQNISLVYQPSDAGVPKTLVPNANDSGLLTTGDYRVVQGTANLPVSVNTDLSTIAYVDMEIILPPTGTVDVTDFQVVGQSDPIPVTIDPLTVVPQTQQQSEERNIDHLFHYYKKALLLKPKKSLLVGWNFPLNPFQFITTTVTTVAAITSYICDQTILRQEAASQIQSGENTVAQRFNLVIRAVAAAATTRFALIQYIDPTSIEPYWSYALSAFARARIFTSHGTSVRLKCRLIYRSSLPSAIGNAEPIASWPAASDPVFSAGWTALTPLNDPAYILPNAYSTDESLGTNSYPGFSFDNFQMPNADNANMTLGVVIYTMDNMNSTATVDEIAFDKISLIPSQFGADALPQTFDDCLRECQYYYEKSYNVGVLPGAIDTSNSYFAEQLASGSAPINFFSRGFQINYRTLKRTVTPTVVLYSPTTAGTPATVHGFILNGSSVVADNNIAITNWNPEIFGQDRIFYKPVNTTALISIVQAANVPEAYFLAHYTVDARLGV